MRVVIHPEADQELAAAALWYDERQPGLGHDLVDDFEQTLSRVLAEATRWRKIRGDNRKIGFRRFPYALVYSVGVGVIYIKAVMHLRRRPFYRSHRE